VRALSTPAVVLRTREFGESDKVVTVLSRALGKFTGIAKGAKRSRRRFAGSLEIFSHVMLDYRLKSHADMAFLERAVLIRPWHHILGSVERYAAASHVIELADKMTAEREVGDELYALVVAALARLDQRPASATTLRILELAAMTACGYRPELERCARCRRPLPSAGDVRVLQSGAGLACASCGEREKFGPTITAGAAAALGRLAQAVESSRRGELAGDPAAAFADDERLEAETGARLAREIRLATTTLLAPHLRSRLRVLELMGV